MVRVERKSAKVCLDGAGGGLPEETEGWKKGSPLRSFWSGKVLSQGFVVL